jgi:signal transduction histidine kinase
MKFQYKVTLIVIFISLSILGIGSVAYSKLAYMSVMENEKKVLIHNAMGVANDLERLLQEKLLLTKTIATAPILLNPLFQSNEHFASYSQEERDSEIQRLNSRWKEAQSDQDPFISPYMNNALAHYLKAQQKALPGMYGEIFITNRYGVMIATTGKLSTLAHSHKYWWKQSYAEGEGRDLFDDRGFDESVGGYVMGVVIPIKKDGEIIGILKSNFNIIMVLQDVIKGYAKKNHGDAMIVRTKGLVILEGNKPPLSSRLNQKLLPKLEKMETGVSIIKEGAHESIYAYAPVRLTLEHSNAIFSGQLKSSDHCQGNTGELWHGVIRYDKDLALLPSHKINSLIVYVGLLLTCILAIIAFFVGRWFTIPISDLALVARRIEKGEYDLKAEVTSKDEIGVLGDAFNKMLQKLNDTTASRDELHLEIQRRKEAEIELIKKDEMMVTQSRQAAMGEMISMIAHQWRQPLAVISMSSSSMLADVEFDTISKSEIKKNATEILNQSDHLTQTIDDFRNFFKPNRKKEAVTMVEVLNDVLDIVLASLKSHDIAIEMTNHTSATILIQKRELIQVILNLINNAKDSLLTHNRDPKIMIRTDEDEHDLMIEICDNGNGIDKEILPKIFDPYFSTKEEKNGTGLGLYMSKMIIQKHLHGTIEVHSTTDKTCFTVKIPREEDNV